MILSSYDMMVVSSPNQFKIYNTSNLDATRPVKDQAKAKRKEHGRQVRKENVRIWRRPILPLVYADTADSAEFIFSVAFVMDDLSSHELSVHYYIRYPASIRPYRMRRLVYNLHD